MKIFKGILSAMIMFIFGAEVGGFWCMVHHHESHK